MTYVVTGACLDVMDRSCVEQCPVDCISIGARMAFIDPGECIDCGACEIACPTNAIYYGPVVPDELREYVHLNRSFFGAESGSS